MSKKGKTGMKGRHDGGDASTGANGTGGKPKDTTGSGKGKNVKPEKPTRDARRRVRQGRATDEARRDAPAASRGEKAKAPKHGGGASAPKAPKRGRQAKAARSSGKGKDMPKGAGMPSAVMVRSLTKQYSRVQAVIDGTGKPHTVVIVDTVSDGDALAGMCRDASTITYNGKALYVPKGTRAIADMLVACWYPLPEQARLPHADVRFCVMMCSHGSGKPLCDDEVTKGSLRKARPTLVACLAVRDAGATTRKRHAGVLFHVLHARRRPEVAGVPVRMPDGTSLACAPRHMSATDPRVCDVASFADDVARAVARARVAVRSGALRQGALPGEGLVRCLDVRVSSGGRTGLLSLDKALCLLKLRDAGMLPSDAYGQRIAGAFADDDRWYVTYAPTSLDTFQPYLATIDHVLPQCVPSSENALCNMALMMQRSNQLKGDARVGDRLDGEPAASLAQVMVLYEAVRCASGIDGEVRADAVECCVQESIACVRLAYGAYGLDTAWS